MLFNNVQDVEVVGGQYGFINFEESCFDNKVHDLLIAYPEYAAAGIGIDWSTKSHDMKFWNIDIEGCGEINWSGWPSGCIFAFGDNLTFDNINVRYTKNGSGSSTGGNGVFVNRVVSDCPLYFTSGTNLEAFHTNNIGWYPGVRPTQHAFNTNETFYGEPANSTMLIGSNKNELPDIAKLKEITRHNKLLMKYLMTAK